MKIEIAYDARMSETGRSLLRIMQAGGIPALDLLVREAIQNSLDAAKKNTTDVIVDFTVGSFSTSEICGYFEEIDNHLNVKYPGENKFIAIRDSHTVGLTGSLRSSDVIDYNYGNLIKLVYQISKPQEEKGSGGSWGLGKTVYFRIGIGFVIYYSRIKTENGYESRLAATLVEDETKKDRLLKSAGKTYRGIAWWGEKDPESEGNSTIPLRSESEINSILNRFGIQPYNGLETGTTVIIPFIDEKKLLSAVKPHDDYKVNTAPWMNSIPEYLKVCIPRWYAPRMSLGKIEAPQKLTAKVNGQPIIPGIMPPIFQLVQQLYVSRPDSLSSFNGKKVNSVSINLRECLESQCAGWLNYLEVDDTDMKIVPPNNLPSPYVYVNKLEEDSSSNPPIFMFMRRPGMVVSYETTGDWVNHVAPSESGKFLVALFVANSANMLKSQKDNTLEDYLRDCEKADHMSWRDDPQQDSGPKNIVVKIRNGVINKLKDVNKPDDSGSEAVTNLSLGSLLAQHFLPPDGFSNWDDSRGGLRGIGGSGGDNGGSPGSNSVVNKTKHMQVKANGDPDYSNSPIKMPIMILMGGSKEGIIEFQIVTEAQPIKGDAWEKDLGTAFPVSVDAFEVLSISEGKNSPGTIFSGNDWINTNKTNKGITFEFGSTQRRIKNKLRIRADRVNNIVIIGNIYYRLSEKVLGEIVVAEEKE